MWHVRVQTYLGKLLFLLSLGYALAPISLFKILTCYFCLWRFSQQPSPPHLVSSLARLRHLQIARDSHAA